MRTGIHSKRILSWIMVLMLLFTSLGGTAAWAMEMPAVETEQSLSETVSDAHLESVSEDEISSLPTMEIAPAPEEESDPSPVPEESGAGEETPMPESEQQPTFAPEPEETELPPEGTPEAEPTESPTPSPTEAPVLKLSNKVLFFECPTLQTSYSMNVGESFSMDALPSHLSAAILPEGEICVFLQLQPEELGAYVAPEDAPAQYESGAPVVYHLEGEAENPCRLYGIADGKEGWFACNEDGTQIFAMMQSVSVQWDASNVDWAQPGTYTIFGSAEGYVLSSAPLEIHLSIAAQADAEEIEESPFSDAVSSDETAPIDEGASGDGQTNLGTHSIRWIGGSNKTEISGSDLIMTPENNIEHYIDCQIDFSMGGEQSAEAGEIEIRIPRHVFYTRENKPYGNIVVPLAQAPQEAGETGFHYSIDEETDEIVITNYRKINPSDVFTCQIRYNFYPQYVADGFTNDALQATFKVTPEGQESISAESEKLSLKLNTSVPDGYVYKQQSQKYELWQSEWGEEPEDSKDYFYVEWRISTTVYSGTQPYRLTFQEQSGNEGEVIGYWEDLSTTRRQLCTQEEYEEHVFLDTMSVGTNRYNNHYVLLRYPRTILAENPSPKIENKIVMKINGYDGDCKEKTGSAYYQYEAPNFSYPGDGYGSMQKYSSESSIRGGIDLLMNGQSLQNTFSLFLTMRTYDLTESGTKSCKTVLEDRVFYLNDERLNADDCAFNSFLISNVIEYSAGTDPEKGWVAVENTDYSSYQPVDVLIKAKGSSEWQKFGTIQKETVSTYQWSDQNGNRRTVSGSSMIDLPEDTYEIRFEHTGTACQVELDMRVQCELYPTEHVLQQLQGKSSPKWYNIDSAYAQAEDGTIFSKYTYMKQFTSALQKMDAAEYGQDICHAYDDCELNSLSRYSVAKKTRISQGTQVKYSREYVKYALVYYNYAIHDTALSHEDLIAMGTVTEEREGIFYELLPLGMTLDADSVHTYASKGSNSYNTRKEYDHTLELIENWRNSGRTMVLIHVSVPEGEQNYDTSSSVTTLYSGFYVTFEAYYSWNNIKDYGTDVTNSMAYYSLSDLENGYADTGGSLTDKALLYDLDGDGNPADAPKNVWYAEAKTTFSPVTAAEMGLKKTVKASEDVDYAMSTTVGAAGSYSYLLRFENGSSGKAKNVILFDVLESAHGGNAHWKGTLSSVDTSQAQEKGIDAVVYYSTYEHFSDLAQNTDLTDLSNAQIWTRTAPQNMADVTAIAIDLRYKADGTEYEFPLSEVVRCTVHMTAPENYQDYVDDPTTEADETAYAYNSAYLHSQLLLSTGDVSNTAVEECARTTVALRAPKVEIHKTSDPASGTQEEPTLVFAGDAITYDVAVSNAEKAETVYDLEIADVICEGLEVQMDALQYYFGTAKTSAKPISESSRISVRKEGSKLIFSVDKLSANETLHLLIPAKVSASATADAVFANTAVLEKFNEKEWDIRSETTYHAVLFGYELPITGAGGSGVFYAAGAGLLLLAGLYLRVHRRREPYERKGREVQ